MRVEEMVEPYLDQLGKPIINQDYTLYYPDDFIEEQLPYFDIKPETNHFRLPDFLKEDFRMLKTAQTANSTIEYFLLRIADIDRGLTFRVKAVLSGNQHSSGYYTILETGTEKVLDPYGLYTSSGKLRVIDLSHSHPAMPEQAQQKILELPSPGDIDIALYGCHRAKRFWLLGGSGKQAVLLVQHHNRWIPPVTDTNPRLVDAYHSLNYEEAYTQLLDCTSRRKLNMFVSKDLENFTIVQA